MQLYILGHKENVVLVNKKTNNLERGFVFRGKNKDGIKGKFGIWIKNRNKEMKRLS